MKRNILCLNCHRELLGDRYPGHADLVGPTEKIILKRGRALASYHCDCCNVVIPPGGDCCARSIILESMDDYYPWEQDYLTTQPAATL
jgi:hypothetical protein